MKYTTPLILSLGLFFAACSPSTAPTEEAQTNKAQAKPRIGIVPQPVQLTTQTGQFALNDRTRVLYPAENADMVRTARYLAEQLSARTGLTIGTAAISAGPAAAEEGIVLELGDIASSNAEAYALTVDSKRVSLLANDPKGTFYGVQTLLQLLPLSLPGEAEPQTWTLPAVQIQDEPRFGYRGMHLDVGRHLFSVEEIKNYIDLLAMHKFNRFHWHLTEDQGWRIEIKQYPRLTQVGAYRKETVIGRKGPNNQYDGKRYGGFYTQDEVREVVKYAQDRFITIIPEIEMPGHSLAALSAYPELGCTDGPFEAATTWGVFEDIYCPSEQTFTFLEKVLLEVMDLFPSEYIHIGGDEAPKARWEESKLAQEVIRREGLKDEHELQTYFIERIEKFLNAKGRKLIGWDEILEGGLSPDATVMSWRGEAGGIEAARQHHDVIMTPTTYVYFDYLQSRSPEEPLGIGGYLPLENVYNYEPLPKELTAEEAKYILGAQANVWTEYISTPEHLEYMVLPRMAALAEVVWSPKEGRGWESFKSRMPQLYRRYYAQGLNFRVPEPVVTKRYQHVSQGDSIRLENTLGFGEVRYTTDGSVPTPNAKRYERPISVRKSTTIRAKTFLPDGRSSVTTITQALLDDELPIGTTYGLRYRYVEEDSLTAVPSFTQVKRMGETMEFRLSEAKTRGSRYAISFEGNLKITTEGLYTFYLTSQHGSRLFLNDQLIVDNDGLHPKQTKEGQITLAEGDYPIRVEYFDAAWGGDLQVMMEGPNFPKQEIPARLLYVKQ
ncbi:hexosaminidase [Catalinimonas alkaloidigena]|uniref:beta-N-acetylhexosaminidase n=1 Tax=Catalinimonas alkaloidigena TaxID=1075417 RepID=A0A1G9P9Z3_9BACT|nr:family 20 glycosylhydrolase [Catalinimonas alkaloidigena]SDL95383.1 hexosaminidase [Catalinimonas alkaloidigena]